MAKNGELYILALAAINKLFSDTSVDMATTKQNLEMLQEEITIMIEAIDNESSVEDV